MNPFKAIGNLFTDIGHVFGAGVAASPLGQMEQPPAPQAAAPPVQTPTGNTSTFKTGTGQPSFLAAAAAPTQQNIAGTKSLLGQ